MKYALLVAALLFLLFSVLLSRDLIDYRISELDFLLGQRSQLEEMANTLSIVTRYELIRGRIEAGEGTERDAWNSTPSRLGP